MKKKLGRSRLSLWITLCVSAVLFAVDGICAFLFDFMPVSVELPVCDAFEYMGFGWRTFQSSPLESYEEAMQPHPTYVFFSIIGLILGMSAVFVVVFAIVSIVRAVKIRKTAKLNGQKIRLTDTFSGKMGLSLFIPLGVSALLFAFHGLCGHFLNHMPLSVTSSYSKWIINETGFGWYLTKSYPYTPDEGPIHPPRYFFSFYPEALILGAAAVFFIVAAVVLITSAVKKRKATEPNGAVSED